MAPRPSPHRRTPRPQSGGEAPVGLRIIGGEFRGRRLRYGGDVRVRPMKDRVREAVFNLVGPTVKGSHAVDLFAGTGALGLEALSRGAATATFLEQHFPTAKIIRENIATLGVEARCQLTAGDTFLWADRHELPTERPWTVFCSPPYALFVERSEAMLKLIRRLRDDAPVGSVLVVEADERFDFAQLPEPEAWDVRPYPPAVVGIYRKGPAASQAE